MSMDAPAPRLAGGLLAPGDPPARQVEKLLRIAEVLMRQVEQRGDDRGAAWAQFHRAAMLEEQVRQRTGDLERALDLLNESNARLAEADRQTGKARADLAGAIEAVQEGFALFDPDDVLVMCNSRFGLHMPDLRPDLAPGLRFADYIALCARSPSLALPEGMTPEGWERQRHARHRDRHALFNVRLTGDRWLQVSEHRTGTGGTVILQTDVTDLVRLERQERSRLLDSQAGMIRATLDHITQGVAIFDAAARLAGWNARLPALIGLAPGRLRPGQEFSHLLDRLSATYRTGAGLTGEDLRLWAAAPTPRPDIGGELAGAGGQVLQLFGQQMPEGGFVISLTDISRERAAMLAMAQANETLEARVAERTLDLRDALARAERANATRTRFVAAASHDLLQPLSAAKLLIGTARDGLGGPAATALAKAQGALESVEGILGALLDISRLEAGPGGIEPAAVRLAPLLEQLTAEFAPAAAAKGIGLAIRPVGATVESDPTYLRRILQNLIGNAIRYTARGRVLVGARRLPGAVRIEVHDTGPGIPDEARAEVFREFHRLNGRASASEGMGLGLAIVERACALLGHGLTLRSTPGRGSCFAVTLPLAPDAPGRVPAPAARQARIALVVDPDPAAARALEAQLEHLGLEVIAAPQAGAALALLDELGILPDLALIAHDPAAGIDGLELARRLRGLGPGLPVRLHCPRPDAPLSEAARREGIPVLAAPPGAAALRAALPPG